MNYIRVLRPTEPNDAFYLFSRQVPHIEFVETFHFNRCNIQSAGVVDMVDGNLLCYGEAEDLNLTSDPEDDTEALTHLWFIK